MVYLKADDTKSEREVLPEEAGSMDYGGKDFLGVRGYCFLREDDRVFRIDRILSLELKEGD